MIFLFFSPHRILSMVHYLSLLFITWFFLLFTTSFIVNIRYHLPLSHLITSSVSGGSDLSKWITPFINCSKLKMLLSVLFIYNSSLHCKFVRVMSHFVALITTYMRLISCLPIFVYCYHIFIGWIITIVIYNRIEIHYISLYTSHCMFFWFFIVIKQ